MSHFYRIHYAAGPSRVVVAADPEAALRLGRRAAQIVCEPDKLARRPVRADDEGHAGTRGLDGCPLCAARKAAGKPPARRTVTMAEFFDFGKYLREVGP